MINRRMLHLKVLLEKIINRIFLYIENLLLLLKRLLNLHGAKDIGSLPNGNSLLRLNNSYLLGLKGSVVQLPKDETIYKTLIKTGGWGIQESEFLGEGLKKFDLNSKTVLLDIGANVGLITLQTLNYSSSKCDVFLFEPIPVHIQAIEYNISNKSNIFRICNFALSDKNGESIIYNDNNNYGNSSLIKSVVHPFKNTEISIKTVETKSFMNLVMKKYDNFVIKSDTQGLDASILSRIPKWIWAQTERAVIEVWALPEINENDIKKLLPLLGSFKTISWHPNGNDKLSLEEIELIWLSKSGASSNLHLAR